MGYHRAFRYRKTSDEDLELLKKGAPIVAIVLIVVSLAFIAAGEIKRLRSVEVDALPYEVWTTYRNNDGQTEYTYRVVYEYEGETYKCVTDGMQETPLGSYIKVKIYKDEPGKIVGKRSFPFWAIPLLLGLSVLIFM